ncbi:salivary protein [Danaus plexippus plexippus]|uniref:Translocon-associated protein subunit delta n=2 Tax=Danaus plexippus TaxID=13037 RepID=A0A212EWF9_DANPL|nr:salivary protein [Danaus plexippus plexippus]
MVTKYLLTVLALAVGTSFAQSCQNPQVEAASFTSLDATVVTQIAYITEFTLKCDNPLPENYALYAEVEGKSLSAARVGDNKYQVSWTEEPSKARSGVHEIHILDEEGWASLRRARRSDPAATVAPLLAIQLQHPGSYSGPWINSEVLATLLSIVIAYTALKNKSMIFLEMTIKQRDRADGDDDPVESMLKKSGCLELHYKVMECINSTKDWRKCQEEVNEFRSCVSKHKESQTRRQ